MESYRIDFNPKARKELISLSKEMQERIFLRVKELAETPFPMV